MMRSPHKTNFVHCENCSGNTHSSCGSGIPGRAPVAADEKGMRGRHAHWQVAGLFLQGPQGETAPRVVGVRR